MKMGGLLKQLPQHSDCGLAEGDRVTCTVTKFCRSFPLPCSPNLLGFQSGAWKKSSGSAMTFAVLLPRQTWRCLRDLLHSGLMASRILPLKFGKKQPFLFNSQMKSVEKE